MADLFDKDARVIRRERAFRSSPVLFLYERAFEDILDRLSAIQRRFGSALLIGTPDPSWPARLGQIAVGVQAIDPGPGFAGAAGALQIEEESIAFSPSNFDLVVAIGTLDTVNDLPGVLLKLRYLLRPDSLLIGAITGGETLPQLRAAMRTADAVAGAAVPRVHPRIEASALGHLLAATGFQFPVVDVDRVKVSYQSLRDLVRDLRAMGATNILAQRSRTPLTRVALTAAEYQFGSNQENGRTVELFELLHFAAWTASAETQRYG